MSLLINIDNGGTLTDVYATDGESAYSTKTLTTPFDLAKCFFDGLTKVSKQIYGDADLGRLLRETEHIRYSTTQGTNALVQRKGPRLGLLLIGGLSAAEMRKVGRDDDLYEALIGDRTRELHLGLDDAQLETATIRGINELVSAGANRVVVSHGGVDHIEREGHIKRILLRRFPQHLLGSVPILYSHELTLDTDGVRRAWSAVFNAFLHPLMERFLYNAEHRLRAENAKNPLLIFRNDGDSARVAKTTAIKTHSSGPRGGLEGARVLARHYGLDHVLTVDVGGTTTDVGEVREGQIRVNRHGRVEDIEVSIPLSDLVSVGVGGSSVIRAESGGIRVGPESVGSVPGPACLGLGGTQATITDAFHLAGLLDPESYFGGELELDIERAKGAIERHVAEPLGISTDEAVVQMVDAWVEKIAQSLTRFGPVSAGTTLMAFGGAGPLAICQIADHVGASRVLIPGLAAVFSAFGLSFSDVSHEYQDQLSSVDVDAAHRVHSELLEKASRGMAGEGYDLGGCEINSMLEVVRDGAKSSHVYNGDLPAELPRDCTATLSINVRKAVEHPRLSSRTEVTTRPAVASAVRAVADANGEFVLPVFKVEHQVPGSAGDGRAVLEQEFFTCHVIEGWRFQLTHNGDILLTRR